MDIINIKQVLVAVISLLAVVNLAQAEEVEPDKFRFAIGGYAIARYDSSVSLTDPDLGAGISIDPQDTLGMEYRAWRHVALGRA